jgi:hypothetical protein
MAIVSVYGLLVPFNVPTIGLVPSGHAGSSMLREQFQAGALTETALEDTRFTEFTINHDKERMASAAIRLIQGHAAVYVVAALSDRSPVTRAIMASQRRWTGWSISFDAAAAVTSINWNAGLKTITSVDFVSGVALCIDAAPAYPTWAVTDRGEAIERIQASEDAALRHEWGSNYKAYDHYLWMLPNQYPNIEAKLAALCPNRESELWLRRVNSGCC